MKWVSISHLALCYVKELLYCKGWVLRVRVAPECRHPQSSSPSASLWWWPQGSKQGGRSARVLALSRAVRRRRNSLTVPHQAESRQEAGEVSVGGCFCRSSYCTIHYYCCCCAKLQLIAPLQRQDGYSGRPVDCNRRWHKRRRRQQTAPCNVV